MGVERRVYVLFYNPVRRLLHKGSDMFKETEKPCFVGVFQERAKCQIKSDEKYVWGVC